MDFLDDHARILTVLACDPDLRIRDIAHDIGTTGARGPADHHG
ncbi:hypothetical protein [Actinomadura luteofluorescens]